MKPVAVIIFVLSIAAFAAAQGLTDEQKAKLKEYRESCVRDTGVDNAAVENIKKGDAQPDEKLNCFAACMLKKIAIMKPDGSIDEEVARSKVPTTIPKEKVDEIINTCKMEVGSTPCETGGKVLGCLLKTNAISILN